MKETPLFYHDKLLNLSMEIPSLWNKYFWFNFSECSTLVDLSDRSHWKQNRWSWRMCQILRNGLFLVPRGFRYHAIHWRFWRHQVVDVNRFVCGLGFGIPYHYERHQVFRKSGLFYRWISLPCFNDFFYLWNDARGLFCRNSTYVYSQSKFLKVAPSLS